MISTRSGKRGIIEIYPKFIIKKSSDLMIRGGDFYAIWIDERGMWSTDEQGRGRLDRPMSWTDTQKKTARALTATFASSICGTRKLA